MSSDSRYQIPDNLRHLVQPMADVYRANRGWAGLSPIFDYGPDRCRDSMITQVLGQSEVGSDEYKVAVMLKDVPRSMRSDLAQAAMRADTN
jgi:hypothetical protein